jgi:hypothetical protein
VFSPISPHSMRKRAGLASAAGAVLVWTGISLAICRLARRRSRVVEPVEEVAAGA